MLGRLRRPRMEIRLRATSSSGEPYTVDFMIQDGRLSVRCNCRAGLFGQLCKHKTELIAGDASRLFDDSDRSKLRDLSTMIANAPKVLQVASEIAESERIIRQEQAKLKKIKKQFAARLKEGIDITNA
jgi:hypothetical protein